MKLLRRVCIRLLTISIIAVLFTAAAFSQATLTSDKSDYAPGTIATFTGSGFEPAETVTMQVVHADGRVDTASDHTPWPVVADASGGFVTTWDVCTSDSDCIGQEFKATADGQSSGLHEEALFMDANTLNISGVSNSQISPNQASSAGVLDNTDITVTNGINGTTTGITVRIRAGTGIGGTLVREFTVGSLAKNTSATVTCWP